MSGLKGIVDPNGNVYHFDHEYLESNPTIPAVDSTLTQEGAAADAAKVGDEISNIKEDLQGLPSVATPEEGDADLYVCDKDGNVLAKFEDGHIKTKNFDSANILASEPFDTFTASDDFVVGSALTLTVTENFKKGDEIYFHLEDGTPFYEYGRYATYYEGTKVISSNRRGSNGYFRHIITEGCASVKVTINGSEYSAAREITLYVYRKNYDPVPKVVTVKADGTGMFTRLKDAVESITDANHVTNPYVIEVYEGTYDTLEGYTQEEINSAGTGDGQTSMVGVKLTDGISLRGVGKCDDIILTAELDSSYSSTVRGQISTLNMQGEGNLENVTIIGKNIRYCVHDDFRAPRNSHDRRVIRNCKFRGTSLSYPPFYTTYGAGMSSPRDYLIENCDFGYDLGIHSNSSYTYGCTIIINNCSGCRLRIGDYASNENDAINRVVVNNCNFQEIKMIKNNSLNTSHMRFEGTGNEQSIINDVTGTLYRFGMVDLVSVGLTTGKMVKRSASGLTLEATADKVVAHGVVIGSDNDFSYVQKCGYVASTMLGLSGLAIGDYVTVDNTGTVITGGTANDAIGVVKYIDDNGTAYINLMF